MLNLNSAFKFQLKSRRQYNCRGRSLKASFPSAVPRQSFCRSNLTIPAFASTNALTVILGMSYISRRQRNYEINNVVNQLQSQGRLPLYKAALGLTLAKNVSFLSYENFF